MKLKFKNRSIEAIIPIAFPLENNLITVQNSILLLKFNENLNADAKTVRNTVLAGLYVEAHNHIFGNNHGTEGGMMNILLNDVLPMLSNGEYPSEINIREPILISEHGQPVEYKLPTLSTKFEQLKYVEIITIQKENRTIKQDISRTASLKTALLHQQQTNKILVAISSGRKNSDESCIAIIMADERDTLREKHDLPLTQGYRQCYYYLIEANRLSDLLIELFKKHHSSFVGFFDENDNQLEEEEPFLAADTCSLDQTKQSSALFFYHSEDRSTELGNVPKVFLHSSQP